MPTYIKLSSGNCYKAPDNWTGAAIGSCMTDAQALVAGFTPDNSCGNYNAGAVCSGSPAFSSGTATIGLSAAPMPITPGYVIITQVGYVGGRVVATTMNQNIAGHLEYSLDNQTFQPSPLSLGQLLAGNYTLYVRDSGNAGVNAQRGFVVGCVPPHALSETILSLNTTTGYATLTTYYGGYDDRFRYELRHGSVVVLESGSATNANLGEGGGARMWSIAEGLQGMPDGLVCSLTVTQSGDMLCQTQESVVLRRA